ncbi:MAG: alpha/beta hydrolase fold domain-containing protein [Deltaproteobacteria bacterium]|nr:alpha/beta hydrolase fold domain-containing protein [Deltaproteobacteria bacterium]
MSGFRELTVPYARAGERELRLFVTAPEGTRGPYPTLLDFHGGAWTHFEPRVDLAWCRELARAGVLSASVEFRLAPEHPWPAVLADARRRGSRRSIAGCANASDHPVAADVRSPRPRAGSPGSTRSSHATPFSAPSRAGSSTARARPRAASAS